MGNTIKLDPAIEKFNSLRETIHEHSYWTPRMVRYALVFGIGIPAGIYWVCKRYDNVFDVQGKTRGMSLYKYPSLIYKNEKEASQSASKETEE
ncbi:hypothetical protein K502DRAFT_347670 [Neoconidiobolus thromboides FSU 785]|nr:hypothetical protein K502DRAFT_347670 [Neoconidiobolus thromboides FSU 785]